jgi:hypothetical protein
MMFDVDRVVYYFELVRFSGVVSSSIMVAVVNFRTGMMDDARACSGSDSGQADKRYERLDSRINQHQRHHIIIESVDRDERTRQ